MLRRWFSSVVGRYVAVTPSVEENRKHISVAFARSPGAGGQNVNKVNTKVELRVPLDDDATRRWIPDVLIERVAALHANRVNKRRELLVTSSRHRTQEDNMRDALGKLQTLLEEANLRDAERLATEVPTWSKEARVQDKKVRGARKELRRSAWLD